MKFSTIGSPFRARPLFQAGGKSRSSGNLFFRPRLEHLEDRRMLSVSPSSSASGAAIHVAAAVVPDLTITKTDSAGGSSITSTTGNVTPGQSLSYTVVVTNVSDGIVRDVTIADSTLTSVLTGDTWTATPTGGATGFSASGSGNIDDTTVELPGGSTVTYVITGTVSPAATGMLSNTATATEIESDPIPATDNDRLVTPGVSSLSGYVYVDANQNHNRTRASRGFPMPRSCLPARPAPAHRSACRRRPTAPAPTASPIWRRATIRSPKPNRRTSSRAKTIIKSAARTAARSHRPPRRTPSRTSR